MMNSAPRLPSDVSLRGHLPTQRVLHVGILVGPGLVQHEELAAAVP